MNLTKVSDDQTARTNPESAAQRAENMFILGCTKVLELCCGPSLRVLRDAYHKVGIDCWGNDIDYRWERYYPCGKWILGNCLDIDYSGFDGIVFAPPVTNGCTGRREDSLMIEEVNPRYRDFIDNTTRNEVVKTLVLPARSLLAGEDKNQYHTLLKYLGDRLVATAVLTEGRRNIRKYVDVYFI